MYVSEVLIRKMSEVFAKPTQRCKPSPNSETIPKLLEENSYLLMVINEQFNKGRFAEALELQKKLHRNLVYLSCLAYPNKVQTSSDDAKLVPIFLISPQNKHRNSFNVFFLLLLLLLSRRLHRI